MVINDRWFIDFLNPNGFFPIITHIKNVKRVPKIYYRLILMSFVFKLYILCVKLVFYFLIYLEKKTQKQNSFNKKFCFLTFFLNHNKEMYI